MNSKALFVLCLLIVTVYSGSLLSGRGFQTSTSIKRSLITETITFTDQNEDNNVPIEGNGKNGELQLVLRQRQARPHMLRSDCNELR